MVEEENAKRKQLSDLKTSRQTLQNFHHFETMPHVFRPKKLYQSYAIACQI